MDIHEKENALDIVTEDRVYHIVAESPEDARYKRVILLGLFILFRSDLAACGRALETQSQEEKMRRSPKSYLLGSATPTLGTPCHSYGGLSVTHRTATFCMWL